MKCVVILQFYWICNFLKKKNVNVFVGVYFLSSYAATITARKYLLLMGWSWFWHYSWHPPVKNTRHSLRTRLKIIKRNQIEASHHEKLSTGVDLSLRAIGHPNFFFGRSPNEEFWGWNINYFLKIHYLRTFLPLVIIIICHFSLISSTGKTILCWALTV